ncbi:uncharacterized protein DUF4249 [Tenacibaculum skagerrakense]|uniref:Uncharacterized protein DUF4249 n=1 Tax=Tenacibaculum skagerrakense TaxID=186571 RepID=A0A4R2NTH9_9FLAO|nr:DUF4249 domain-containing protein [Tenacibaculum skagerrakense]TCP25167.1 uncharacterized protein DUF4249 [Tenacibaculum skagerrakense]
MKKSIYILFVAISTIFSSCTDVVDVDVPNGGARLVVEASINWEKGTTGNEQTIKLSTSTAYFDSNAVIPATGATVTVTKENDGAQFVFADQNNGEYTTTNFVPEIGAVYTLNIVYNGETYAATETLIGFTEINSVSQEEGFNEGEYRVRVLFDDPADEVNYYMGEFVQDNLAVPSLASIRDEFVNGNEAFVLHFDEKNVPGTDIDIKVFGISERFYFYIEQLIQQSGTQGGAGGPFQTTPAQLKGNCVNVNNANEEVLGYFRLSQFARTSYTIQ